MNYQKMLLPNFVTAMNALLPFIRFTKPVYIFDQLFLRVNYPETIYPTAFG
jgi:hypothetical protein